jgi:competence protein ComEC
MQIVHRHFIPVWRSAPLLRLLAALALGIVVGSHGPPPAAVLKVTMVAGAFFSIASSWWWQKRPLMASLMLHLALFFGGCLLVNAHRTAHQPSFIGRHYKPGMAMVLTLQEPPVPKEKSWKAEASIQWLTPHQQWQSASGKVIVYLQKSPKAAALQYGSRLLLVKPLQPIANAGNPGGFNYKDYTARQHIFYQVFAKDEEYECLQGQAGHPFQRKLFEWRGWVLRQITRYIPSPAENGVAQALLIGYRGDLDKNLVEKYANTGVVHIIAISGMHLGMIYALLLFILKPLGSSKRMRILQALLSVGIIWLFTLLTGAAPSISRAAVMFTMVATGQLLYRQSSIYNTLAAAAILLLLINPFGLWDVGFQLSFAAVLSIAIFYNPILQWWTPGLLPLRYIWQMMAVTIAAQILTLPLGIYHFHQFPVYFLLANVVAVPLSALALYGLLLLLALSWWPNVAMLLGLACTWLIKSLNHFIEWVNQLPLTTISHLQISMLQAALLFAMVAALAGWWLLQRRSGLVWLLVLITCFLVLRATQWIQTTQQHRLIVYHVPQHTAIDYIQGRRAAFMGDSAMAATGFLQNFHLLPSRIYQQYEVVQTTRFDMASNYQITVGGQRITLLRQAIDYRKSKPLQTDILVVSAQATGNPHRILPLIPCHTIVMDGSNSQARIARWKSAADSLHLRLHNATRDGAFVLDLASH